MPTSRLGCAPPSLGPAGSPGTRDGCRTCRGEGRGPGRWCIVPRTAGLVGPGGLGLVVLGEVSEPGPTLVFALALPRGALGPCGPGWRVLHLAALSVSQPAPRACMARAAGRPASASTGAPATPSRATAPAPRAGPAWPVRRVSAGQAEASRGRRGSVGAGGLWEPGRPPSRPGPALSSVAGDGSLVGGSIVLRCDLGPAVGPVPPPLLCEDVGSEALGAGSVGGAGAPESRPRKWDPCPSPPLQSAPQGASEPAASSTARASTAASATGAQAAAAAQPGGPGTSARAVSGTGWGPVQGGPEAPLSPKEVARTPH